MKKIFFMVTMMLILFSGINDLVVNATEFATESFDARTPKEYSDVIDFKKTNCETTDISICAFDINESGMIALCKKSIFSYKRVVDIYDSNGMFIYGYQFETEGHIFVEWCGNQLKIIRSKGNVIMTIKNHQITQLDTFAETEENNEVRNQLLSDVRQIDDNTYKIENVWFLPNLPEFWGYSKLIHCDSNGKETVLYDNTSSHSTKIAVLFICIVVAVVGLIYILFKQFSYKVGMEIY